MTIRSIEKFANNFIIILWKSSHILGHDGFGGGYGGWMHDHGYPPHGQHLGGGGGGFGGTPPSGGIHGRYVIHNSYRMIQLALDITVWIK